MTSSNGTTLTRAGSGGLVAGILMIVGGALAIFLVAPVLLIIGAVVKGLALLLVLGGLAFILEVLLIAFGIRKLVARSRRRA